MPPQEPLTPEPILQTAMGFMAAKHLLVANEIGLFTVLEDRACTLDEVAAQTQVPHRTARIVADAMVALGFLQKEGARYKNSPVTRAFLGGEGGTDLRPVLRFFNHICYRNWMKLDESVRAGKGMAGRFQFANEQEVEIFSKGVEGLTAGAAHMLPEVYDFSRHWRVLDLGGGTGSYLLPLLERYPSLNATLFELPRVAEVAQRVLSGHTHAGRIKVVAGDIFAAPIPAGHDAIIIADVLHTLSVEHNRQMLASLRKSVEPGARVLLVDLFTDPSHTQPVAAAILAGEFMIMTGEGDVYSQQETEQWLQETGWTPVEFKALSGPRSLLAAEAV